MRGPLFEYGNVMVAVAVLGLLVFAVSYAGFFAWRKTAAGRSLLYLVLSMLALAAQVLASLINPNYPGRDWIRAVVYTAIAAAVWRLVFTLWKSWRHSSFQITARKKSKEDKK